MPLAELLDSIDPIIELNDKWGKSADHLIDPPPFQRVYLTLIALLRLLNWIASVALDC